MNPETQLGWLEASVYRDSVEYLKMAMLFLDHHSNVPILRSRDEKYVASTL